MKRRHTFQPMVSRLFFCFTYLLWVHWAKWYNTRLVPNNNAFHAIFTQVALILASISCDTERNYCERSQNKPSHFSLQNDEVYSSMCNMEWILLQRSEQRMYRFLLRKCQKPVVLTIGGFCDLNLNASLKVFLVETRWIAVKFLWRIESLSSHLFPCPTNQFFSSHCYWNIANKIIIGWAKKTIESELWFSIATDNSEELLVWAKKKLFLFIFGTGLQIHLFLYDDCIFKCWLSMRISSF